MKTLLITRPLPEEVVEAARAAYAVTVREDTSNLSRNEMLAALAGYDAVLCTLGDRFDAETFKTPPRARMLANFGVGYNHIDVTAAAEHGVIVTNTPGAVTDATADIAVTLILMTARRAGEGERLLRAGKWEGWHPTQLLGTHVSGKRLGIIGMGRIGQAIAHRCHHGFGMEVLFHNRSPKDHPFARQAEMDEVLAADFVVIAVPASPATKHLIGAAELAKMTGILINIARGDIVDEAALVTALQNGLKGAGLDVYEREPEVSPELLTMENVTLLPHLGTAALDVRTQMGLMAVDNLLAFAKGEEPPNRV
ncbi:2-hydroxyacid dehydrogenase [Falsirhodobacter xinxiangensis]|uniref:2-hydroxyacid dehydrogenase n=1 Tax=Falsirhodobacter xinxiangensis TaxID=2530049 RepID=UPI00145BE845|nr:D-glycerate dehydrogenase [Rhodobacter xinxiangensis]